VSRVEGLSPSVPLRARPAPAPGWWRRVSAAPTALREAPPPARRTGLPFTGLVVFTFVLLVSPQTAIPALGALRPAFVAIALAFAADLADQWLAGRRRAPAPPELAIAAALLAWAVITVPLSFWPGGSLAFLVGLYAKTLAVFWLVTRVVTTPDRLSRIMWCLVTMSAVPAAAALVNSARGRLQGGRVAAYESPLGGNPNDLALMLSLMIPLAVALYLTTRRRSARLVLVLVVLLDVAAIVMTFSRGGFLALALTIVLLAWTFGRRSRGAVLSALFVIGLLALPLLPADYFARLGTITDIDADPTGSARERFSDLQVATRYVGEHPIVGAGIGMGILAMNEARGKRWKDIHNVYLQYGVELGLPGLALFVWLLARCTRAARAAARAWEAAGDRRAAHLAAALGVSLLTFAVGGFFATLGYHFGVYYLAGLALAARAMTVRPRPGAPA
jgi:O-antigen ligase